MSFAAGKLSIVVIGRNEAARLDRCLASVKAMHLDSSQTEFLYVDSASTDNSVAIAQSHRFQVIPLITDRPTAARGRNAGWLAATGDIILFLDGDTILHPTFVAAALPYFSDPTIAVIWGHRRELYPEHSLYNRVLDLDWIYRPGLTPFCGGDALFRRDVLARLQGFDETLIAGEEPELCRRILATGSTILHIDTPMTTHDLAIRSFAPYWNRAERAGHAYAEVAARFAHTAEPFWQNEVNGNRKRALILMALPLAGLILTAWLHSPWPLLVAAALLLILALRTSWHARWKSNDPLTLLLYGIHSHFQQIPIFFGQLRFLRNRRAGRKTQLLEYK